MAEQSKPNTGKAVVPPKDTDSPDRQTPQAEPTQSTSTQSEPTQAEQPKQEGTENERSSGLHDPNVNRASDADLAEKAGLTEGEIKALRDNAGVNQSAGHQADLPAWEASPAGVAFKDSESDREKAVEDEQKAYDEQFTSEGLTVAETAYMEATSTVTKV